MKSLVSLFTNTVLNILFFSGSPARTRSASVLSSTGLPSIASSSRIILARDANLMMFSSPPFFRLLSSSMSRSSCALSRASNMTLSASHTSLAVSTYVTVMRCVAQPRSHGPEEARPTAAVLRTCPLQDHPIREEGPPKVQDKRHGLLAGDDGASHRRRPSS